jgi:1-acyl-sn-glycerol-3-phosphate acyltransferase
MLYKILRLPARLLIHLYCRKIIINNSRRLYEHGPLLIAANHPNSFLDAIILATLFRHPVHSLARGDAFNGRFISKILIAFNMLPVYRISEGAENLDNNYATFEACRDIFRYNGIVLIFSEGRCINEWHLRPLKKGTARLALTAWEQDIPLKIIPLGINYSSFRKFGKNVVLNFGIPIEKEDIQKGPAAGKSVLEFNEKLRQQLQGLVYEIDKKDSAALKKTFHVRQPLLKKILLFFPAIAGCIIHFPIYYLIHLCIKNRASDHYDSIMTSVLFFIYPWYVLLIGCVALYFTKDVWCVALFIILPFTAWSYLQLKKQ